MYFGEEQLEIVSLQFKKQRTKYGREVIIHPVPTRGNSGDITLHSLVAKNGNFLNPQLSADKKWASLSGYDGECRILAFGRIGELPFCVDITYPD